MSSRTIEPQLEAKKARKQPPISWFYPLLGTVTALAVLAALAAALAA